MDRRRLLSHPTLAAAVLVLLLNDHWGKQAWPGAVTGKLSDLAGVYVVAMVLGAAVGRAAPALASSGVGFALLKLDGDVARLAAPLLGGVTRTDPTDLVALAMLWPAARVLAGRERVVRSAARDVLVVVLGLCTIATTTATSCEPRAGVVSLGLGADGALVAELYESGSTGWARSVDGGGTWTLLAPGAPAPALVATSAIEGCVDPSFCYRVVPGSAVEQHRIGERWELAYGFTPTQIETMENRSGGGVCRAHEGSFGSLLVVDGGAGGPIVVVAMGEQGVLRRDADGVWTRWAVGSYEPISVTPIPVAGRLALLAPVALLLLSPLVGWSARRGRRLSVGLGAFGCATAMLALLGVVAFAAGWYSPGVWVVAVLTAACLVATVAVGRSSRSWWLRTPSVPTTPPPWPPPPPPGTRNRDESET